LPESSVYNATKAAVRSFARTWTTDLKDRRIRVNAVSPGSIDTPGLSDLLASSEIGEQRKKMISNTVPLSRFGTPDEIAKAVVFLASDDASYITGTELCVDGAASHKCRKLPPVVSLWSSCRFSSAAHGLDDRRTGYLFCSTIA